MNTPARSSYLWVNNLRTHTLNWGEPGDEPVILLLHGLASNARIWELTAPHLASQGWRVIAPDLRGHGQTDKPEGSYGFDQYRADLAALLGALELRRPVLVGHSWGASVVVDYAAHYPVGPLSPKGIVLVDGGVTQLDQTPGATWESVRDRLTPPRLAGMPLVDFLEWINNWNGSWKPDEQAQQIILANFAIDQNERISPHLSFENHMKIVRAMWEFKTYQAMERLACPVLAVLAQPEAANRRDSDEFYRLKQEGIHRAAEILNDFRVSWVADSVHDIPLQHPEKLAQLLADFVRDMPR